MLLFLPAALLAVLTLFDDDDTDGSGFARWPVVAALLLARLCLDPDHAPPAFRLLSSILSTAAAFWSDGGGSARVAYGSEKAEAEAEAVVAAPDGQKRKASAAAAAAARRGEKADGILARAWRWTEGVFPEGLPEECGPLISTFVCGLMSMIWWTICDVSSQYFIWGGFHNKKRLLVRCSFGFFYHGPSFHFYFNALGLDSSRTAAAAKALLDHFLCYPLFTLIFERIAFGGRYDCLSYHDVPVTDRHDLILSEYRCYVTILMVAAGFVAFYPHKDDLHVLFAHDLWIAFYCFTQIC